MDEKRNFQWDGVLTKRMSERNRTTRLWTVVLSAASLMILVPPVVSAETFRGHAKFDRKTEVVVKTTPSSGRVRFAARFVRIHCDDGTDDVYSSSINARLDRDGRFDGATSSYDTRDGYQVFFYASGQVRDRRAAGRLFLFFDPGDRGSATCRTSGPVRWRASAQN